MQVSTDTKPIIIIGYSGHSYVICDALLSGKKDIIGYCEKEKKKENPYGINYLGNEEEDMARKQLQEYNHFIAIGNNLARKKIARKLWTSISKRAVNIIHPYSSVSANVDLETGIYIGNGCIINPMSKIGEGAICNSQSVIEHECHIGSYSHIAPGAILCGNVTVGENTFIGARTVIKEGIKIGKNVIIGAGTVVIKDISDGSKIVGNPQKNI